jgi:hypothetical protein
MKELERNEKLDMKFYMTSLLACLLTKEVNPSPKKLLQIKLNEIDDAVLMDAYMRVRRVYDKLKSDDKALKGPMLTAKLQTHVKQSLARKKV